MKVRIETDWSTGEYHVYLYEKYGDRLFVGKPMDLVMEEVSDYRPGKCLVGKLPPALRLGREMASNLFAELVKELTSLGFKNSKNEEALTDVLKAKNEHLEDMRKLVFAGKDAK